MYFETFFVFYEEREVFMDFLAQTADLALEETDLKTLEAFNEIKTINALKTQNWEHFSTQNIPTDFMFCVNDLLKETFIVVRLEQDPNLSLLPKLKHFCLTLKQHLKKDFNFHYLTQKLPNKDWLETYEQSVLPVQCGKFHIRPSWHAKPSDIPTDYDILINPGLAFGSGHHESTSMCLELLAKLDLKDKKALDVGCGSGILSIAMKKQGIKSLMSCDTDELAIQATLQNISLNQLALNKQDKIFQGSTQHIDETFDIVVANIVADVIKSLHSEFLRLCDNILIISGILETHLDSVLRVYRDFEILEQQKRNEWVALKLLKKQNN
ncbi:50S ribosomal protein L11 methyltransferase [Helicobacter cetorum]|uniref:50S ribosomal protein L11 methyltransferase n=1 Tax=Helicobacter cetorum TaxID=138563 RepID=UPI003AF0993B